jgi:exopolysaccharide biosynthesis polyprenyl glycosylphosphotransferase
MQKYEPYKNLCKFGFNLIIWSLHTWIWAIVWMREYADIILRPFGYKGNWLVIAVYAILSFFFTSLYDGFRIGYYGREDVVLSGVIAVIFTNSITYLQTCLVGRAIMQPVPFVWMTLADIITFYIWAVIVSHLYIKIFPARVVLMIYGGSGLATNLVKKMAGRSEKYRIQEAVSVDMEEAELNRKILAHSSVILCDVPSSIRNDLIKFCFQNDIRVYTTPKISDILIRSAEEITLFDTPLLLNRNRGISFEQKILKRIMDVVFAGLMLIVSLPFMLCVAIAIKIEDRGPVIYSQERLTQNGRRFYVKKFRSMIVDAERENGAQLSTKRDSRITKTGAVIRRLRLDELPQFWNILVGDMSIVGPRPERPELAEGHMESMPEFAYRLKVRAGLTGYAQVTGKYNTMAYDKLKMDLMYIAGHSLLLDFKIIFMTLKTIFKKESTEGAE